MSSTSSDHLAKHRYFDRNFKSDAVRVLPGEYFYTRENLMIMTVLGSCVAACVRDRVSGVGGMNHFLLPEGGDPDSPVSESMRYGSYAMEVLINDLFKAGARRENLEAKVFGGGNVIQGMTSIAVGSRNAKFVVNYLNTDRIPILVQDLEDIYPRKVCFFPNSGKVLVKKLKQQVPDQLITSERDYQRRLKVIKRDAGEIDLF
jgi:chemotaxis protein CheD